MEQLHSTCKGMSYRSRQRPVNGHTLEHVECPAVEAGTALSERLPVPAKAPVAATVANATATVSTASVVRIKTPLCEVGRDTALGVR